jgi:ribosomal protein S18 acetylase RimI-like enzyme
VLEIDLEAASLDDVEEMLRLRQRVSAWLASQDIDLWQTPLPEGRLVEWIQDHEVLVQRDGDCIIGAVALLAHDPDLWGEDTTAATYVHALMVDRSYAGQGLGARMLERVETIARARGARYVRLDAGANLERLQRWYDARGYERVATRSLTDAGGTFDVALRQKPL